MVTPYQTRQRTYYWFDDTGLGKNILLHIYVYIKMLKEVTKHVRIAEILITMLTHMYSFKPVDWITAYPLLILTRMFQIIEQLL